MTTTFQPPCRLLMGPGPINADPRVSRAMSAALVGQYDPAMTGYMNETQQLYRQVFRTHNEATLLVDGTSRAGIEAALVSLVAPGERVLVPMFGRFGLLLKEIAERCGAEVHTIEAPWGEVFTPEQIEQALARVKPHVLALVQGDTSTTMCQPLAGIGALCRRHGALFYTDVTASLAGNELRVDDWQIDAATAGLQKCLAGPSGSSPITLSARAVDKIMQRAHIEAGLRQSSDEAGHAQPIRSNYLDLSQILKYWGPERLNHHTEATAMLYGARMCAALLVEEGMDQAIARHQLHGQAMAAGLTAMGLELFGDQQHRMHNVVGVYIPEGLDGEAVRRCLLEDFAIEIGTSFGPLHGRIWRIGTMGYNARRDCVFTTLAALEQVLGLFDITVPAGEAVRAAHRIYSTSTLQDTPHA
ncbi:pyridoxal-phosphate-dependent aminotransferase family protein [Larsenimonas rhizosphaerae]|uniref:pyridoxal-phosphate-dependent aminotransferase family protein n=1 Tax=Larsenimonas rhizosphaerae TaxID=2944682 RepID=UPI0020345E6F|nr:alanine--glyoxylate aminotransferase family protein [Larsenimonas rhizosphaerae]MCM2130767.1 alanine--glyoxylate aminotransferase family protein [Larsenimonas rhizosphaerae]